MPKKPNNISIATTTRHIRTLIDPIIRPGAKKPRKLTRRKP